MRLGFLAEEFAEFVADDFYDLLVGRKLQQNFGADGFGAHVRDEFIGDADVDVTLEQGAAQIRRLKRLDLRPSRPSAPSIRRPRR